MPKPTNTAAAFAAAYAAALAVTLAVLPGQAEAGGSHRHTAHGAGPSLIVSVRSVPYQRYAHARTPRHDVVTRRIARRVVNRELPLRRLLDLGPAYRGYRVDAVVVRVKGRRSRANLHLVSNGRSLDRERVRGAKRVRLHPRKKRILGSDISDLKLAVRGKVFIDTIKVRLTRIDRRPYRWRTGHTRTGAIRFLFSSHPMTSIRF